MAKKRYRGGRTSISFKNLGSGLRAAEGRIKEQRQIEINALELQREQQKAIDNLQIKGLADKANFEEGVLSKKHNLENLSRTRQYEALGLKADRDVQRLRDIAKQKKEKAEYLEQLAPKQAEAFFKLAKGAIDVADAFETRAARKKYEDEQSNPDEAADAKAWQERKSKWKVLNSKANTEADGYTGRWLTNNVLNGSRNERWTEEAWGIFQDQRVSRQTEVRDIIYNRFGDVLTEDNVDEAYQFAAEMALEELNVHPDTKIGRQILRQYRAWGEQQRQGIVQISDTKDTRSTLVRLSDIVHSKLTSLSQLEGEELESSWADINIMFNQGVLESARGTHKVGNDYQVGLPDGLGGGYSHFLGVFLQNHGHKYDTKVLKEHISKLKTRDDSTVFGLTNEFYTVKHEVRTDDAFTDYDTWLQQSKTKLENKRKATANKLRITLDDERTAILNDPNQGVITDEHKWKWFERIATADISSTERTSLYKSLGDDYTGFSNGSKILLARQFAKDGDIEQLENVVNSLQPAERKKLQSTIELYKRLKLARPEDTNFQDGKVSKEIIQGISGGLTSFGRGKLNDSGEKAADFHKKIVMQKFNELKGSHPNESVVFQQALASVQKEYIDTAAEVTWNPNTKRYELVSGGNINNPFNYISGRGGIAGFFKPGATFIKFNDADSNNADILERIYTNTLTEPPVDIDSATEGIQVKELDDNTIKYGDYDQVLKHVRLISPDNWASFKSKLAEEVKNPGTYEDLTEIMPEQLKKLADANPDKTRVQVLNEYLEWDSKRNKKDDSWRISADAQDAARINNNGTVVKPRNVFGYNCFNACAAQNIIPKSYMTEEWVKDNNASTKELFDRSKGISWTIDSESGSFISTDIEKWITEGGMKFMSTSDTTSLQTLMSLGLLEWDNTVGWTETDKQREIRTNLYNKKLRIKQLRAEQDFANPLRRRK